MGHPCRIQRGLARRLCILLACTGPLSTLAPRVIIQRNKRQEGSQSAVGLKQVSEVHLPIGRCKCVVLFEPPAAVEVVHLDALT